MVFCSFLSGCSLANDFGDFVFEESGRSDGGPDDERDSGSSSNPGGSGGKGGKSDASVTPDSGHGEDASTTAGRR